MIPLPYGPIRIDPCFNAEVPNIGDLVKYKDGNGTVTTMRVLAVEWDYTYSPRHVIVTAEMGGWSANLIMSDIVGNLTTTLNEAMAI